MPHHVIVDGSNLATEGRSAPSLGQLNDAVLAYIEDHPSALVTVVVDATFGHRIDSKEVADFDDAVANNEIVAPPAGAIGRGDAFVLSIANKVSGTIISNDSFQEFHGQYTWLFDEGRLVGGKPVPHVGWVFVNRLPVRGPTSRKAVQKSKRTSDDVPGGKSGGKGVGGKGAGQASDKGSGKRASGKASAAASGPPPVPKAPPPGGRLSKAAKVAAEAPAVVEAPRNVGPGANDLLPFLTFVEHHPPGTSVNAIVDSYSSHGAYVSIGDVRGYVPLRLMAEPAPRSAREFMKVGESVTLVVESFGAGRRSVDLGLPTMVAVQAVEVKAKRGKKPSGNKPSENKAPTKKAPTKKAPTKKAPIRKAAATQAAAGMVAAEQAPVEASPATKAPAKKAGTKKAPARKAPAKKAAAKETPANKVAANKVAANKVAANKVAANKVAANKVATQKVSAKKASAKKAPAKKATAAPKPRGSAAG